MITFTLHVLDWTHKIVCWMNIIDAQRPISIPGSFYHLGGGGGVSHLGGGGGGSGSETPGSESKDSKVEAEVAEGFVGCLRLIYVDKLAARVKLLSGFPPIFWVKFENKSRYS